MKIPLYVIDAFTRKIFGGNPAAVCPLEEWLPDEQMQAVAQENNLSETAFFVPRDGGYQLRWFTPTVEVDLCGHATLASAFVVFNYLDPARDSVAFESKSGTLTVTRDGERLRLNFPARTSSPAPAPAALVEGLGVEPREVLRSSVGASADYLAVLGSEGEVRNLQPRFESFTRLDTLGVIVTARGEEADFVSRYFAPRAGINEDPATGAAHCTLTPYWSEKLSKRRLRALQVSRRGGELFCEPDGDRVLIAGHATRYSEGFIYL